MAIYYIDPHSNVNGNGAWANQYSLWNITRATAASGDEYRIKGVALANLLTATTYTANYTNSQTLTLTAGGSLGADFAGNDVIWLPGINGFQKVSSVTGNALSFYQMVFWSNTANQTDITLRRVDTATYPGGNTLTAYFTANLTGSNITVSDCWTADGTRVTDGTVKTLINTSSATTGALQVYPETASAGLSIAVDPRRTYNLENTHIVPGNFANGQATFNLLSSNVTCTLGSIASGSTNAPVVVGGTPGGVTNISLTIGSVAGGVSLTGSNITVTISNVVANTNGAIHPTTTTQTINSKVTYGNVTTYTTSTGVGSVLIGSTTDTTGIIYTINGPWDHYTSTTGYSIATGYGNYAISWGPSFTLTGNRRATNITALGNRWTIGTTTSSTGFRRIPDIPVPTGWSTPSVYMNATTSSILAGSASSNTVPSQGIVSCPTQIGSAQRSGGRNAYTNNLFINRDGTDPYELLGTYNPIATTATNPTYVQTVVAFPTTSVVRTTGPALQLLLSSRVTNFWVAGAPCVSTKTFKIPVTSGVTYTTSGYIRTDISTYATGDCKVRVLQNDTTLLANQNMTTSCINSWENFSMTFVPTITGEATFCMDVYYAAAGNFYLDDFTIQ